MSAACAKASGGTGNINEKDSNLYPQQAYTWERHTDK